jgi:hypothetical protein
MSLDNYLNKINEQARELEILNQSLNDSSIQQEVLKERVKQLEKEKGGDGDINGNSKPRGLSIAENSFKRQMVRQMDEVKSLMERKSKSLSHAEHKLQIVADENEALKAQLTSATARINKLKAMKNPQTPSEYKLARQRGGTASSRIVPAPSGHPQATPTVAKFNEFKNQLKVSRDTISELQQKLDEMSKKRDEAVSQVVELKNAIKLSVPTSQVSDHMLLLEKLVWLRKEIIDGGLIQDTVEENEEERERDDVDLESNDIRKLQPVEERVYDNDNANEDVNVDPGNTVNSNSNRRMSMQSASKSMPRRGSIIRERVTLRDSGFVGVDDQDEEHLIEFHGHRRRGSFTPQYPTEYEKGRELLAESSRERRLREEREYEEELELLRNVKIMRETDYTQYSNAIGAGYNSGEMHSITKQNFDRLVSDHTILLEFVGRDLEKCAVLAGDLDVAKAEIEGLNELQKSTNERLETAHRVMDDATEEVAMLTAKNDELRADLKKIEVTYKHTLEENSVLREDVVTSSNEAALLRNQIKKLEDELHDYDKRYKFVEECQEKETTRAEQLSQQNDELERLMRDMEDHVGELQKEIESYKERDNSCGDDEQSYTKRRGAVTNNGDDSDVPMQSLSEAVTVEQSFMDWQVRRRSSVVTGGNRGDDAMSSDGNTDTDPRGINKRVISAEELSDLREVDKAVAQLSSSLMDYLEHQDFTVNNRNTIDQLPNSSGASESSIDEMNLNYNVTQEIRDAVSKDHGWIDLEAVQGFSGPLYHCITTLHADYIDAKAKMTRAQELSEICKQKQIEIERQAKQIGKEGALALEQASRTVSQQACEMRELREISNRQKVASSELQLFADLLLNGVDTLDIGNQPEIKELHLAVQNVISPDNSSKKVGFGSASHIGTRLSPLRKEDSSDHSPSRTPRRASIAGSNSSRRTSKSPTRNANGPMDMTDLHEASEDRLQGMAESADPRRLGSATRQVLRRILREAGTAGAARQECQTLRRRLTEADMRIERHNREINAIKVAYESSKDVAYLRTDHAMTEAEELRSALEETVTIVEKQNILAMSLEAKYEAAVREASTSASQVTVYQQREQTCHRALHGALYSAVEKLEDYLLSPKGESLSPHVRGKLAALYLPADTVSTYDLIRFDEKVIVAVMSCLGIECATTLPTMPPYSYNASQVILGYGDNVSSSNSNSSALNELEYMTAASAVMAHAHSHDEKFTHSDAPSKSHSFAVQFRRATRFMKRSGSGDVMSSESELGPAPGLDHEPLSPSGLDHELSSPLSSTFPVILEGNEDEESDGDVVGEQLDATSTRGPSRTTRKSIANLMTSRRMSVAVDINESKAINTGGGISSCSDNATTTTTTTTGEIKEEDNDSVDSALSPLSSARAKFNRMKMKKQSIAVPNDRREEEPDPNPDPDLNPNPNPNPGED